MKIYYVYILKCSDSSYYVGMTSNLDKRIIEHNLGKFQNAYTFTRRPVELVWYQDFLEPNQAISFEKKIKKWSRAKKEAIIQDNWEVLPKLSECKNETHHRNKAFDSH
ncbi:GIY-YIG nuclease family protein [Flavobacterium luminosum]|uniref:GIY-YIG nuclease family protein n=1 Tax=Flavobacterium luminosum TaxID=2949086 RepID=A0ABT0TQD0_9FLAO|nr:GIY-YIG nuclease family protein [Flavobacterium sp. HXWNR70]MCL9809083.1 GIY-YIG nuclease family protein [Flavobacterium sp. HXWNR70]